MATYLKKTYPNNPFRPNTGVFEDRSYTTAIAVSEKHLSSINNSSFPYKGYEKCSREEYQKIVEDNTKFELSITKPRTSRYGKPVNWIDKRGKQK